MGFHFVIPAGVVLPHALNLEHSSRARRALRNARVVVAVYPNGVQELLHGGDDLTHQLALAGEIDGAAVEGAMLIRVDRSDHADLIVLHLCRQKPQTPAQYQQMIDGTHLPFGGGQP